MKTKTIMPPQFRDRAAKIMVDVRNRTCIDDVDAEVIRKILQDELEEECRMLDCYYWEEYYNELDSARNAGYDDGYDDGYTKSHSGV